MESANPRAFMTRLEPAKIELFSDINRVKFYIKDESDKRGNPFGTFKDRRNEELIRVYSHVKRINPLYFVQISSGNSALSMGKYALRESKDGRIVEAVSIVPPELNPEIKKALLECSKVVELDLSKKEISFEVMQEKVREITGYEGPSENILAVESHNLPGGYRQIVYEIRKQLEILKEPSPDYIVCPVGEGELLTEIAQESEFAFPDKPPIIVAGTIENNIFVHPDGKEDGFVRIRDIGNEIADKLVNGYSKFLKGVRNLERRGRVKFSVADPVGIADMYYELKRLGIDAEPSAAVAFWAARNYEFPPGSNVVLINTGKGIYSEELVSEVAENKNAPGMVRLKDNRLVPTPDIRSEIGDSAELKGKHPTYEIFRSKEAIERMAEARAPDSPEGTAKVDEEKILDYYVKFIDKQGILRKGSTIVSCGCGTGEYLPWALENFEGVIAIDFSRPALKAAGKLVAMEKPDGIKRLALVEGDFSDMQWMPSESVDFAVCASNTIESDTFEMQKAAFSEMNRILRHPTADSASMLLFTFYIQTKKSMRAQRDFYEKLGFTLEEPNHVEGGKHFAIFRNADGKEIRSLRLSTLKDITDIVGEHFGIMHVGDLGGAVGYVLAVPKGDKKALGAELLKAVLENKRSSISILLLAGADTEQRDSFKNTPLCICSERGQSGRTDELLGKGANPNVENREGNSPLILACLQSEARNEENPSEKKGNEARYYDVVNYLLKKDADIFHRNNAGINALSAALVGGNKKIFWAVMKKAVKKYAEEEAFLKKRAEEKIEKKKNEKAVDGKEAQKIGYEITDEMIDALFEDDEDELSQNTLKNLNSRFRRLFRGEQGSKTPLMLALENEEFRIAECLIRNELSLGGNPFNAVWEGKTAISIAIETSPRCALFLLGQMKKYSSFSPAPLFCSSISWNGLGRVNGDRSSTPLHKVAKVRGESGPEIARKLVELGASIEEENEWGRTPLEEAIVRENGGVAALLVEIAKKDHEEYLKKHGELKEAISLGDLNKALDLSRHIKLKSKMSLNGRVLFKTIELAYAMEEQARIEKMCLENRERREKEGMPVTISPSEPFVSDVARKEWDIDSRFGAPDRVPNILRKLIELKVDLEEVDSEGRTALTYAIELGVEKAAILLVGGGAKTDLINKNGKTVMQLAEEKGMESLKEWIKDPEGMRKKTPDTRLEIKDDDIDYLFDD